MLGLRLQVRNEFCPKGPSTNVMRTLGFHVGNYSYGLGNVLILWRLGPSGLRRKVPWKLCR